jgi:phenylalanyl-tRNA synthetase beta chain
MKASYRWLRTLVPQLTDSPEALATKLTFAGIEVEEIIKFGQGATACVVAQVVSIRPHPSKSGLRLVTVDVGEKTQEIVCGAPNVPDAGGLVVLAPLGAYLPAKDLTIARRAIGGIESEGMLCSESELGLSDESDGILVLPSGTAAKGAPLIAAVPETEDTIFELGITPNRPDALGHIGLAREIAALYKFPWSPPTPRAPALADMTVESLGISVRVDERERCPHFAAGAAVEVSVKPSPLWLRYRLSALGIRPISNVVDVTNLVMLEYGHPMHAFDLDKLEKNEALVVVRVAKSGEKLTTLDGVERTLSSDDLVVCDGNRPVGLAGVMGGKSSEVTEATKRVLLECAYFDPRGIRRSARRYGLHTDASHRFERGVDPSDIEQVLASASTWLSKLAGAKVASGTVHVQGTVRFPKPIRLRSSRIRTMLGVEIPWTEAIATLESLGCKVLRNTGATAEIEAPAHRPDITREIDLIEEVIRVKGLNAIPEVLPAVRPTRDVGAGEAFLARVRDAATFCGLSEAVVLGMTSDEILLNGKAPKASVRLKNPLSERGAVMRTSLLPGLLESVSLARRQNQRDAKLFAMGPTFFENGSALPREQLMFSVLMVGERAEHLTRPSPVDVWDAKGVAEAILWRLGNWTISLLRDASNPQLHPRGAARIFVGDCLVGHLGPLHPDVLEAFDLGEHAVSVEFDLSVLRELTRAAPKFAGLPKFPANSRDVALIVREAVQAGDVGDAIRKAAGDLASEVELFDRFTGGQVAAGHVSLAFRVLYRAESRTLTDAEVDAKHTLVVAEIQTRFGAEVRA